MTFDLQATRHARFRFCVLMVLIGVLGTSVRAFSTFEPQSGAGLTKPEALAVPSPSPKVAEVNSEGRSAMPAMPAICVALIVLGVYTLREAYRRSRLMCFALIVFVGITAYGVV